MNGKNEDLPLYDTTAITKTTSPREHFANRALVLALLWLLWIVWVVVVHAVHPINGCPVQISESTAVGVLEDLQIGLDFVKFPCAFYLDAKLDYVAGSREEYNLHFNQTAKSLANFMPINGYTGEYSFPILRERLTVRYHHNCALVEFQCLIEFKSSRTRLEQPEAFRIEQPQREPIPPLVEFVAFLVYLICCFGCIGLCGRICCCCLCLPCKSMKAAE